ncbi:SGPP2; sphingosine-1-phosphate phosphatase 2 [Kyrpidia tusciae DSM 2912]|uniref:SGPP2 sphingosine-1-phosphate phosphatase 2 n=1 Tax=Kyrpidia tusciae (strain DSM 2912 / NBRC 15312 / T2) TaxID=562970 RepID=D5WY17_KYRT2|nr:SGPP2; sphingosine-1-phosphate phosphatase 2 [Kyrpidia tusciae DSM 2912]
MRVAERAPADGAIRCATGKMWVMGDGPLHAREGCFVCAGNEGAGAFTKIFRTGGAAFGAIGGGARL